MKIKICPLTAKLSAVLGIPASLSPYQTHPFTESLKAGSVSCKVNRYENEEQVIPDSQGLSLT